MSEPLQVKISGIPLRCRHCDGNAFNEVSAKMDRIALGGLLEGPWGHQVTVYACDNCGLAH